MREPLITLAAPAMFPSNPSDGPPLRSAAHTRTDTPADRGATLGLPRQTVRWSLTRAPLTAGMATALEPTFPTVGRDPIRALVAEVGPPIDESISFWLAPPTLAALSIGRIG